jgi:hypothetical protein
MRNRLLIAGLLAAVTLPVVASAPAVSAQPYDPGCRADNHANNTAGTVLGGVAGALLGSAVAGRHDRGAGAVIGGVGGAVVGNSIARSNDHPCPPGYVYYGPPAPPPPPPPGYGPGYPPPTPGSFWYGAPAAIHERIDFLYQRISNARAAGWLGRHDAEAAYHELSDIRRQEADMRYRDGGHLSPPDRGYLQSRLDGLSQRIHWQSHGG